MSPNKQPTAYAVKRADDLELFTLVQSRAKATAKQTEYENEFSESFLITPIYQQEFPYERLPATWNGQDWRCRIPPTLEVVNIPIE